MIFNKAHFHSHQHDGPCGPREGGRCCISERFDAEHPLPQLHELADGPWSAWMHQLCFPWAPLLSPMSPSIFADDSDYKLRTMLIQFSNSRKPGRDVSVLGAKWDLSMIPAEQIILPKRDVFSVMPYVWLQWPCCAKSPGTELALKAKVCLPGSAELLVASAHGPWTRWAQHLASPTPAQGYVQCQPGWLLVYTSTSAPWSATWHTSPCYLTSTCNDLANALGEETLAHRRSVLSINHLVPLSS